MSTRYRRIRRRSSTEAASAKKENRMEQSFFGEAKHETFFQPASAIQRKCDNCEKEEKLQRTPEKKEDEKVQRATDKKEDEKVQRAADKKEEEKVQKKDATGSSNSGGNISNYVNSLNGKGNPLPAKANHFFSARMGYDFSNVKVHTDKEAAQSAKVVNAKAYTIGEHIVFNEEQYNTESIEGKKLMAHELTHVMQQQANAHESENLERIQRKITYSKPQYQNDDPIPKILKPGGSKLGETYITVNGKKLTTKLDAVKTIFEAFNNNLSLAFDSSSKTCKVDTSNLAIDISAHITIIKDPIKDKWSGVYPGSLVTGSATCSKLPYVNVELVVVPSGGQLLSSSVWIDEMQHYSDIMTLSKTHLEAYHAYLDNLSFNADSAADCPAKFALEIGNKDLMMATAFADSWLAAVQVYDQPGGAHHYSSVTDARNCTLVTVTVSY